MSVQNNQVDVQNNQVDATHIMVEISLEDWTKIAAYIQAEITQNGRS